VTIYAREREAAGGGDSPSKAKEPAAAVTAVLTITSPSSPSKKYDLAELRAMADDGKVQLSRLVPFAGSPTVSVVVVTSRSGAVSVFSFAEISSSSSSSLSPSLDVSGDALRLVAAPGRSLDDVASIELRVLVPSK
jgi:hypothetical protein